MTAPTFHDDIATVKSAVYGAILPGATVGQCIAVAQALERVAARLVPVAAVAEAKGKRS